MTQDPYLEFDLLYGTLAENTVCDKGKLWELFQLAKERAGHCAEVGVYKGGSAKLLAKAFHGTVHIFDTFTGMPETDSSIDDHKKGDFSDTSLEHVKNVLKGCPNVVIYPGLFPETAEPIKWLRFSLVHVDCDIYSSVMAACRFFAPRLSVFGVMVFDDYGFYDCKGATKAVDEFFNSRHLFFHRNGLVVRLHRSTL
jgi:O-methyltransferase